MKFSSYTVAALVLAIPAFGAPSASKLRKVAGPWKTDSYIVVLKPGVSRASHVQSLSQVASAEAKSGAFAEITSQYHENVINGYAATLRGGALAKLLADPDVDFIEQDGIASIKYEDLGDAPDIQLDDLEARSEEHDVLEKRDNYGSGTVIYGIDTGIYVGHQAFGGRASWGAVFGGYRAQDGNGHGTHTAGTAAGRGYGVATSARIVAIKVLSDSGSGYNSDVISGVNYAYNQFRANRKPSVVNLSLGSSAYTALDNAVSNAIAGGLHFAVSAGNDNANANTKSPARVGTANTVGAIDSSNRKASFSNYGAVLDVWALGVNVLSTWIGSPTATRYLSGTSMASPRVAGILAVALGKYGQVSPYSLSQSLKSRSVAVVTGAPSGTTTRKAQLW